MLIYFNPFAGISGDMFSGALIDAGADFGFIEDIFKGLNLEGIRISADKTVKDGFSAVKFNVYDEKEDIPIDNISNHKHRHLKDIIALLSSGIRDTEILHSSIEIFTRLAQAEAAVHGTDVNSIHFHEVGAYDAIADIVCGVAAMHFLKPERVISAPVNTGRGMVKCEHGVLPVPAPAVMEMLKDCLSYSDGTEGELATPTGVALLTHFCKEYSFMPLGRVKTTGYGAGTKTFTIPNLLRVTLY